MKSKVEEPIMEQNTGVATAAPKQVKMEYVQDPNGILHTYANHFAIGQTVFDLRVIFGELSDVNQERIQVTQHVQVTMTWLEAKALAESLFAYVKAYEQAYGPIKTEFTAIQNPKMPEVPKIIPIKAP